MADTQEQLGEVQGPVINITDLENVVKIIDHAAEQGAFKGWAVIEQVLAVRNKVQAFVAAAQPQEPASEEVPAKAAKKTAAKTATKSRKTSK